MNDYPQRLTAVFITHNYALLILSTFDLAYESSTVTMFFPYAVHGKKAMPKQCTMPKASESQNLLYVLHGFTNSR